MQKLFITHGIALLIGLAGGAYLTTKGIAILWNIGSIVAFSLLGSVAFVAFKIWRKRKRKSEAEA